MRGSRECRVIRVIGKEWTEIGKAYSLPLDPTLLVWTQAGIPASILAVALKVYEADHPDGQLRTLLTGRAPMRPRPIRHRETYTQRPY